MTFVIAKTLAFNEVSNLMFLNLFQAEVLAKYKPVVNMTLLIPNLRHAERKAAKALECFKSIRHIVLYYEDIVQNRTVKLLTSLKLRRRLIN